MSPAQIHPDDLERTNVYWEDNVADPFIRTCIRGLWTWIESLGRDDLFITYKSPHYQVWHKPFSHGRSAEWYFQGGKGVPGRHIHFRLRKSTLDVERTLRAELSKSHEQPFNKKPRKAGDDWFTFNVYSKQDLDVAKKVLINHFDS